MKKPLCFRFEQSGFYKYLRLSLCLALARSAAPLRFRGTASSRRSLSARTDA